MITFIIPSTNRDTLSRAIESLQNQTNTNWKAVIVYDGVRGDSFYDERIRTLLIDKKGNQGDDNGEAGLVRNEGIKLVDTEWIGFLDDDDTIGKDYVKILEEKYLEYDLVIWRMVYTDGKIIPRFGNSQLRFGNIGISFCYKAKLDVMFKENRTGEDFDFVKQLLGETDNYIIAHEIMYRVKW